MKTLLLIFLCSVLSIPPCFAKKAAPHTPEHPPSIEFRSYEKGGAFPEIYRDDFAHTLKEYPRGRFARAYRGERASLHRYFLRAQTVFEDGDDSDAMSYVLLKLFFGCRDFRFSRALETEDYPVRQAVGRLLDPLLTENHIHAPLTRSNYHFHRRLARARAAPHD